MARRKVFISYAHADAALVRHDAELLRAGGVDVFIDVRDIDYGTTWREALIRAIDACERVMVFWSAAARVSEWVDREWRLAVERGKKVVPTLLDETPLPEELAVFQALQRFALGRLAGSPPTEPRPRAAPGAGAASPPARRSRLGLAWGAAGGGLALASVALLLATPLLQRAPPPAATVAEGRAAPEAPAASSAGTPAAVPAPAAEPAAAPPPARPASATLEEILEALRRREATVRSHQARAEPEAPAPVALPVLATAFAVLAVALLGWARWQARLRRELDAKAPKPVEPMGDVDPAPPAAFEVTPSPLPQPRPSAPAADLERTRLARAYAEAVFAV